MVKKQPKILLVDDEEKILESLSAALSDEGMEVKSCRTAEEAVPLLERGSFDCALLDIWLPGRDGLGLLEEIKKRWPETAVVMISGHGTIETAVKAVKLGAFDFLEKPLNLEKVILDIRHALDLSRLSREYQRLRGELIGEEELIGRSEVITRLRETIDKVAPTEGWVLITGENGTGKEVVAKSIHRQSLRREGPFIAVNCAAIPEELIESELFGYEKGAFTGADKRRQGKFEIADGGTIFFDEIGDMSLATQAKVLRVLQEQEFVKLGGSETIRVDVRVIAASNKNLEEEMKKGNFREDLFYRLNVIPLYIPPLRERRMDIPLLIEHFLKIFSSKSRLTVKKIHPHVVDALQQYQWPGNVRELKNIIERMVILSSGETITIKDLPAGIVVGDAATSTPLFSQADLKEARTAFEKQFILRRLIEKNYNVPETASSLGMDRTTLYRKVKQLGISLELAEQDKPKESGASGK
jgi:two-component system nitrogen regulation response regulator NtrX